MNKTIVRNVLSLAGIQGMNYILPLITLPYLVRTLGPEGYGVLGYMLAVMQYGCLITDYGFNLSATRQIAINQNNKKRVSEIFWGVISAKLILSLISFLLILGFVLLEKNISSHMDVLFASFGLVLGNVLFPTWLFQGKERMGWIAIANIAARFTAVPLIFVFVHSSDDTWVAALITGSTSVLAGIIGICFVFRNKWIDFRLPSLSIITFQFKEGWHIFVSSAAISMYTTTTTVILGMLAGPVAVGFYVAADKLRLAVQGLIMPIAQALYPRINALMQKDDQAAFSLIRKLLIIQGSGTFLLSIILFIGASFFINLLYGEQFQASVGVLHWLAWLPAIIGVSNVYGYQTLLVMGMKKIFSRIVLIGGTLSLITIYPLVMMYNITGAAISVIIAELAVNFLMLYVIIKNKYPIFIKPRG